jgi:hypothetical protein
MPTVYAYTDSYVAPQVTQEREARAIADVAAYGTFSAAMTERLVRLRAYILACQESQRAPDDLWSAKAAQYTKDFAALLPLARATTAAEQGTTPMIGSIPLERA